MDCPACNHPIKGKKLPDGSTDFACPNCGWGVGTTGPPTRDRSPVRPTGLRVAIFVFGALLVIFGPYAALRIGAPMLLDNGYPAFADAADRFVAALDIHYWWVTALYIFLAASFSPSYDPEKLGWFGGRVDNPFTMEDDWERQKRTFAAILLPGKVVVAAARITWHFATAKS